MGCRKVLSESAGVRPNTLEDATMVWNKVVVAASSHHRSPGSTTGESQIPASKQIPIRRYVTVSQEAKTYQLRYCKSLVKRQWGQTQKACFCLLKGWECVMC